MRTFLQIFTLPTVLTILRVLAIPVLIAGGDVGQWRVPPLPSPVCLESNAMRCTA